MFANFKPKSSVSMAKIRKMVHSNPDLIGVDKAETPDLFLTVVYGFLNAVFSFFCLCNLVAEPESGVSPTEQRCMSKTSWDFFWGCNPTTVLKSSFVNQ